MISGTLALSGLPRSARIYTFGALAFLVTLMFGASYFPTPSFFWGLGFGRTFLALGLVFLPVTNAGHFRITLLLLSALVAVSMNHPLGLVGVTILYLVADTALDSLLLEQATEQDAPLEIGMLSCFRFLGLWCGLFLQHSHRAWLPPPERIVFAALALFFLFWSITRENKTDRLIPTGIKPGKKPPRIVLEDAVFHLRNSRALGSLLNLLCTSILAGLAVGPLLPYPLLHPTFAGQWLASIIPHLQFLGIGILATWLSEKFKLQTQLLLSATWCLAIHAAMLLPSFPDELKWARGLLLASILLAGRAVLRQSFRLPPLLRSTLLVTTWSIGGTSGVFLAKSLKPDGILLVSVGCLLIICLYAGLVRNQENQATQVVEIPLHAKSEARFGDRIHDFEAAPTRTTRKKRWLRLSTALNFFLVSLPVWILLAATISCCLIFTLHLFKSKVTWEHRLNQAAKVFRTELFLSAFERRLTEEMLASSRIPSDWNNFIATSFESDNEPLTDIDLWKTPYRFTNNPKEITILCAGPDRQFETADDMQRHVKKPSGTL